MRDVVTSFYCDVLKRLIAGGRISTSDNVLVVCGGTLDEAVLRQMGFQNFTLTNLDEVVAAVRQDAENLSYPDRSFDIAIVHAGLHHCHSPHRALLEMYRVARKCTLAFESRDSLLMRIAIRLGLTMDYEIDSVTHDGKGGTANTGIPNYVYRWTERDVINTIASYDPARLPDVRFFHDMRLPLQRFGRSGKPVLRLIGSAIEPLSSLFAALVPSQCNEFAFAVFKGRLHPWISDNSDDVVADDGRGDVRVRMGASIG